MTVNTTKKEPIRASEIDPKFKYEISKMHGGKKLLKCFQCGTCTSDCPVARFSSSDHEDFSTLKKPIEATGATCLSYIDETECCGASSVGLSDKVALELAREKLNQIKIVEAQLLKTICAFCQIMFDVSELRIEKMFNEAYGIPILHYPQLLGSAMGISLEELAFNELRVDASKVIKQVQEGAE